MKRAIEVGEIRKGDLIRGEWADETANEYRALRDGDERGIEKGRTTYLLDRPTPPVALPEVPTLGWATFGGTDRCLAVWKTRGGHLDITCEHGLGKVGGAQESVTEFVAAVAVPKDALEALREFITSVAPLGITDREGWVRCGEMINDFLAAIPTPGDAS